MYNADKLTSIDLGRQGENLARTVEIDVSGMLAQWPDAVITLLVKRKHDAEPYIADTTVKDGVLFWPITTVETADAGDGKLEIRATCGEVIAKSATGSFRVTASLTGSGTEPPATEQGWVEKVLAAGAGVEQSANRAIDAADRAEAAAETAESSIAQTQSAAETATEKAEEAEDSAEAACAASANSAASTQAAQEARVGAEEAKTTAASSASVAEQAKDAAEAAQKAAAAQAAAAEEAAQAADTSAQEAQTSANAAAASEQEAKSSEAVAEQSAQAASDAKGQAESARDNAKASEKAAASSATAAKASAEAADGSATAASDASTEALERLNAAEAARDAAQTAQKAAEESAAQAEQSAVKAGEAAQAALGILDDAVTATDSTWSSQRIADVLCAPFEMSGNPIACHPVEGSPLSVVASWGPRQHFEWQSKEAESTQITTTGAQMLQPTSTLGGAADLVITANDDGSYTYVSTDAVYQSARFYNIAPITLKAGVSYTLSIDKELDVDIRVAGGGRIVAGETSVTFEPSADTLVDHVAIDRPTGYSGTNTVKVMLCEGTTAKPWEPYTGGQAAPCPDYPQEITDNLPAGDYYVPCATGGYWKVTLDAVMGGVPGYADTVEIDAYTGRYRLVRRTAVIVLDGNEAWAVGGKYLEDGTDWYYQTDQYVEDAPDAAGVPLICGHYPMAAVSNNNTVQGVGIFWRITRDTANLDGSTFYADLEICEGATVDGDFSMGSSTCQLAGTVNGTIHINSSECMVYLESVNATCTLRANHKFVLGTAEFASKPENVTIQLTQTAVREMIENEYTAAWLREAIVYHYAQTYPMPLSVQVQLEGFAPGAGGNSGIFGHNALRVVQATPAEGDTDRPAGEGITLLLTVELWGANADLYEFVGGVDQMEARLWVTVEKMPMTVTACSFEAEYNGSDNFQNVKLTDATLACAYDTDSPYLTDPIGAGLTANVDINPQRNDVLNVQWEDGKPAANEKLYAWFAKEYVSFTATAEDGNNYDIQPVFNETRLTYTILPKEVTVSGDIRFTTESRPGSAKDALGQSGLSFDGFIGGDSYGSIRGALTSLELLDAEGTDLTQAAPGVYQVASITSVGSNYCFKPDNLTVTVLMVGDGSVTMESWNEGETPAEPVAVSDTHTEKAAVITYAAQGTDVNNDSLWSDQKPTAPGAYTVRAVWPEQLGYDRLVRTANFSIVSSVDWSAVHWNYDPLDPTRTTITLEGLPDYLAQDAVYSNNTALYLDDTGKYRTATVEFPSYPNLTVPDEIKSIEWYCKKGYTYGTYTLRLKAVNCDVTFTPRTAQPGQTLSAGAKIYSNQEIYIHVTVPEGYTLVALALTNSSFTQVVENKDESLKQDGARYKLTAPNDTKSYDLNVLAFAMPEDGISLSQGSPASLIYYAPSPDGKRPGYSETLDLTEYFDLAPEVQYWFTSSGSNNGKFSLNGSILSWTSGDVTSDGCDFQVKQGITWDKWSSQDSVAVGQQTISSNASLNVVQERVSQPDFNGTASLPVETAQPGDTIAAVLKNFTDYDRADVRWQWQRNPLGFWEDIPGATEMTYTVTDEDQDCRLRLCYNVGMGTDVHGMFTNEVTCGEAWTYSTTIFADRTTVEKDEQTTLTVTVRRDDGAPGTGMVQWYMNGAALGEPVAMTAGAVQLKLRGEELELGQYTVYAIFQSKSGATLPTDEVTVTVSKIDLSDLLYTDTPIDTSVYYRGGTIPLWHTITVTYDQENWPQELSFPDCLTVTAYYNGAANQDKKKNYVTVSSDSIVYGANRPAQYVLKVEVNSDLYCGTLTTGTLTVKEAPLTVKPKDIYAMRGETITLGPEIIDDGITSFGLHGNDSWSVWIEYTVTDSQGEVVATGTSREPLSVELPVGEYTVSIDPQTPSTNQNQVYGNLYNKDNKLEPYVMQGIYDVTLLPGKLVITEEPYVNPTAVSRSGDYLDIDVENWNLDTCPYAGYDFDTSALPAGFSMDDLDFVVTYNGEVTTNLDLVCTEAILKNVAALKIDEKQGTVRLYPLWQGTYTITAQLKQGVTGYQFNAQTATVHVGTVPSVISIYVEEPDKIYHPGDELVVIVDETGEARRYDGTPFWWTSDQTVTFTVGEQSIKGKYTLLNYPMRCVLTLPDDFQPGQYEITMDPGYYTYGMAPEGQYGYEPVTPVSFRVENLEYIVTIPASVTMDETGKASLPLSCSQLEGGSRVTVTVDSANDMKLQGETGTIAYTLTAQNGMAIFDGNTAATFTGTGETTLSLNVAEGQDLAPGQYTDTLTFTASAE